MKSVMLSLPTLMKGKLPLCKRFPMGFSLVELLVALALMGLVSLSIANFLMKSNVTSSSLGARFKEANEIQALVDDMRDDFHKGVYVSDNSFDHRLEYTTYDSSGNASKKIYGLCYYSSTPASTDTTCPVSSVSNTIPYLKLSTDGGTTWGSPYKMSAFNKYKLSGTPKFIYMDAYNGCSDYVDDNANGVWTLAETANFDWSCYPSTDGASWAPDFPSQSYRVVLQSFHFTTGTGNPEVIRNLPDIFLKMSPGLVRSYGSVAAPGVRDPNYVQKILTQSAAYNTNQFFSTTFDARNTAYDPSRDRLITVGNYLAGGSTKIYVTDRMGIILNKPYTTSTSTLQLQSVAVENNGNNIMVLESGNKVYRYDLSGSTTLSPITTLDLASPSVLVAQPKAIAFDASTPTDVYVLGIDPSVSTSWKIYEINYSTRAVVSSWALPAAFNGTTVPGGGLAIEPTTGDFLVTLNSVSGTSPNATIALYRIQRSNAAVYSGYPMNIRINDFGSTATSTFGNWGLGYDPVKNRLFLSDSASRTVYEIVPDRLIAPVQ